VQGLQGLTCPGDRVGKVLGNARARILCAQPPVSVCVRASPAGSALTPQTGGAGSGTAARPRTAPQGMEGAELLGFSTTLKHPKKEKKEETAQVYSAKQWQHARMRWAQWREGAAAPRTCLKLMIPCSFVLKQVKHHSGELPVREVHALQEVLVRHQTPAQRAGARTTLRKKTHDTSKTSAHRARRTRGKRANCKENRAPVEVARGVTLAGVVPPVHVQLVEAPEVRLGLLQVEVVQLLKAPKLQVGAPGGQLQLLGLQRQRHRPQTHAL